MAAIIALIIATITIVINHRSCEVGKAFMTLPHLSAAHWPSLAGHFNWHGTEIPKGRQDEWFHTRAKPQKQGLMCA